MADPRNSSKNRKKQPPVAGASADEMRGASPAGDNASQPPADDTLTVRATGPNQAEMAMTHGRGAKGDADGAYAGDGTHGEGKSDAQEAQEAAQQAPESPVPPQWTQGRVAPVPDHVDAHFSPQHGDHSIRWPSDNVAVPPAELSLMISEAAYYLAERRGFHAGYDIEDWLAAEAEITARMREIAKASTVGTPAG